MSRGDDRYFRKNHEGYWIYHGFDKHAATSTYGKEAYGFKLRINLKAADYRRYQLLIVNFLTAGGDYAKFKSEGLDAVVQFKQPTLHCQKEWAHQDRFANNGQFTLYLVEPYDYKKIQALIEHLQQFLTRLGVEPAQPMAADFALKGSANMSLRLEALDNEYIDVETLVSDDRVMGAYQALMASTAFYRCFGEKGELSSTKKNGAFQKMMTYGFKLCQRGEDEVGIALQKVALKLRHMYERTASPSFEERCAVLTGADFNLLASVEWLGVVKKHLMHSMDLAQGIIFSLYVYINRETASLADGADDLSTGRGIGLFGLCQEHAVLRAAHKLLAYAIANGKGPLNLSEVERKACLRCPEADGVWCEVLYSCGLIPLIKGKSDWADLTTIRPDDSGCVIC